MASPGGSARRRVFLQVWLSTEQQLEAMSRLQATGSRASLSRSRTACAFKCRLSWTLVTLSRASGVAWEDHCCLAGGGELDSDGCPALLCPRSHELLLGRARVVCVPAQQGVPRDAAEGDATAEGSHQGR